MQVGWSDRSLDNLYKNNHPLQSLIMLLFGVFFPLHLYGFFPSLNAR